MDTPIAFVEPGRFEIHCHHSPPAFYPEESHRTVQVCVPSSPITSINRLRRTFQCSIDDLCEHPRLADFARVWQPRPDHQPCEQ